MLCRRAVAGGASARAWALPGAGPATLGRMELGLAGTLMVLFVLAFARDPRTMRCAVLLVGAMSALLVRLASEVLAAIAERSDQAAAWILLGLLVVLGLLLLVGAVMLVLNGFTMLRREGRRLSNLLSLILGLVLVGAIVVAVMVLASGSSHLVVLLLAASLPPGFLAFGFVAYLVYTPLYQAYARGMRTNVEAVVVLGSGLIRGEVPPLLAGRLDRARELYDSVLAAGRQPLVVTSGGQGEDEPRPSTSGSAGSLRRPSPSRMSPATQRKTCATPPGSSPSAESAGPWPW